jgi:hypothetical protein
MTSMPSCSCPDVAVAADLDETVNVYRQRDQQFLEVLPVLQRERHFGDRRCQLPWIGIQYLQPV